VTIGLPTDHLTLVASWGDYRKTTGPVVYMEHGIGHSYGNKHPSYVGGAGKDRAVMFFNQHELSQRKNGVAYPKTPGYIIGTPKMDTVVPHPVTDKKIVCISFHWDCAVSPESRSAYSFYAKTVLKLAKSTKYHLIMHGHPHMFGAWQRMIQRLGVEFYEDFNDILEM
jgi:hypothetical protein